MQANRMLGRTPSALAAGATSGGGKKPIRVQI